MPDWWVNFWYDYGPIVVWFFLGVLTVLVVETVHEAWTERRTEEDEEQTVEIEEIDHVQR